MSFATPRNVPSFTNPQREVDNKYWGSSGQVHPTSRGVGGMFKGTASQELPLYKDKPYSTYGRRKRDWLLKKRIIFALLSVVGLAFWYFSGSGRTKSRDAGIKETLDKIKDVVPSRSNIPKKKPSKADAIWLERREQVKGAFVTSWDAYEHYAWGFDKFHPLSKQGTQMAPKGMGWIIVDAIDTMMIMGLTKQLAHARAWVATTLDYDQNQEVNTFETTIRMLGGLLSAHYLSTTFGMDPGAKANEDLYLEKASDLADRLSGAYKSRSGVPFASVNLKTSEGVISHQDGGASSTAEATTLQLEMKYLSHLTGEVLYWQISEKVMQVVDDNMQQDGLLPIFVYADTGKFRGREIRLGSRGDSYYEYLLKQYLQTNRTEEIYADMWHESLQGVKKHLVKKSVPKGFTFIAELPQGIGRPISPKMDHLVCFMPGTILLGTTNGTTVDNVKQRGLWTAREEEDLNLAKELMKTCYEMYHSTKTGLAPEITFFNTQQDSTTDITIKPQDAHNLQRPETVESLFMMWRLTRDEIYREWGWEIFQAFMNHSVVPDGQGFTSLESVLNVPVSQRDNMESFWLAETLKYLYLLFSEDELLPLTDVVFNTEAHPLPKFKPKDTMKTGWTRKPRQQDKKSTSTMTQSSTTPSIAVAAVTSTVSVGVSTTVTTTSASSIAMTTVTRTGGK